MSLASPTSIVTAIAVFGVCCQVASCASRSSGVMSAKGAIWTKRNGKSVPQARRQSAISAGNSARYCCSRWTLASPWYQMTPRIA